MSKPYPFKFVPLSDEEKAERRKLFNAEWSIEVDMVKSVPGNIYLAEKYAQMAEQIYNMEVRPDDVWVVTYPKCGTTWTQVRVRRDQTWRSAAVVILYVHYSWYSDGVDYMSVVMGRAQAQARKPGLGQ